MKTVEQILFDISVDIQNELLHQCKRANCDDWQTDIINENVSGVFDLNKQRYLSEFKKSIKQAQIDILKEFEHEILDNIASNRIYTTSVIDIANTIRAKIEGGNPIIKTEIPICQFCGKYKTTQGNGILHQLCECGRIEGGVE